MLKLPSGSHPSLGTGPTRRLPHARSSSRAPECQALDRREGRRHRRRPQHPRAAAASPAPTRRALASPPLPSPCSLCRPNASTKHSRRHYRSKVELPISPLRPSSAPISPSVGFAAARHSLGFTSQCRSVAGLVSLRPRRSCRPPRLVFLPRLANAKVEGVPPCR